jgi:Xaa-Pro aminopeptidase
LPGILIYCDSSMAKTIQSQPLSFTREFFEHSRANLRGLIPDTELIVVAAHGLLQWSGDSTFPFRQDSNFWYLTGVNEPDITLVIDGEHEYLIVPGRSATREAFDGSIDAGKLTEISGISTVMSEDDGWETLTARLKQVKQVATLLAPPEYVEQYGIYTNPARARLTRQLKNANDTLEIIDIRPAMASMRVIKRPLELAAIQQAIDITIAGIRTVTQAEALRAASREYQIEADLTREFRHAGSNGHAFSPIIAAGPRAVTLHNVANEGPVEPGQLLVLDVGADVRHYAADITRTVAVGEVSERQRAVHAAVLDTQNFAMSLLKPGALIKENEQKVEDYLGQKLIDLGLIKEIDHETVRKYYPHSTSHFLGLDVHDVGDYDMPLASGMVLTCEPGIYIPEEGIGVRIEDDILITETGCTNLSQALKRDL